MRVVALLARLLQELVPIGLARLDRRQRVLKTEGVLLLGEDWQGTFMQGFLTDWRGI